MVVFRKKKLMHCFKRFNEYCWSNLDDVLIKIEKFEEHIDNLELILDRKV